MDMAVLTPKEVAARWKCSAAVVRKMFRQGRLAGFRVGTDIRITQASVDAWERGERGEEAAKPTRPTKAGRRHDRPVRAPKRAVQGFRCLGPVPE